MSSNNLEEVKKIIRSLLISAKNGLTSKQLELDYISQIGTPIPYESHGHLSLESFLYSIPDVVLITKRTKPLHLKGVATNETSHIARMVQMQTGGNSGIVPILDNSRNKHKLFSSNSLQRSKCHPFVPEYVSVQVREVLLTYPNGLMLTYFSGAYQKRFGHYLQFVKFGVSNLHELFNHVIGVGIVSRNGTDYVELTNDTLRKNPSPDKSPPGFSRHSSKPSFSEIIKHNITKSPNMASNGDTQTTPDKPTSNLQPCVTESQPLLENPLAHDKEQEQADTILTPDASHQIEKNITWLELLDKTGTFSPVQDGKTDENHHESPPSTPGTSVSKFTPPTFPPLVSKPINQAARLEMYKHKHVQDMSSKLSKEISTLLAALPPRIPLDELVEAYKMQFGFDIPFREFGFSSSQDLIQSLWQTCNLDTKENELFVSAVASSHPLSADPAPFEEFANKSHPSIAPEIADRVRKLLLKWPSGMPISLLQEKFLDAYREDLPYLELGFDDVFEMMISMPDYVILIPRVGNEPSKGEYILQGIPIRTEECVDQLLPPPGEYIPSKRDVIISYANQAIPTNWEFKVYIPFISNPDRFWVQIVGPMTSSALEDHLEDITQFYNQMNQENKLEFLLNNPVEGHNCAAPYQKDGYYYRAKILKIPFPDQAEVYYVDYGNKSRVPLGSLRQLKHGHMVLPAQAIACRLANVRPVDGVRWPAGSAHRMKDLTNNLELFCKVQNVEPDDTLSVHLYHSNSESGISINRALISCGIACYEENNTPLNPTRACMTPEETHFISPPQLLNIAYSFPPQQFQYNQPPPHPLPLPYPHNIPYYPIPYSYPAQQNQFAFPFPAHPCHMPPYPQPQQPSLQHAAAYIPPPVQPVPQIPVRPTANIQLGSRMVAPSSPSRNTLPSLQDSYVYNDRDNQILEKLLKEKENRLCKIEETNSSAFMGTFEKVQNFLLTSTCPDDLETQRNSDCLRLEQLKSQQRSVVSKGVDLQDATAYDLYLTQLRHLASEIDELESKLSDSSPSLSGQISPPTQLTSPALPSPPPPATQSQQGMPPLAALQLVGRGRVVQVGETSGVRPQFRYKGIGRGGKMSDLV